MNPGKVQRHKPQSIPSSRPADEMKDVWETIAAVSVAHLVDAQASLDALKRTLRWPHGAGMSYDMACQGVAVALIALKECGVEYELEQDARHQTRKYETSEAPTQSGEGWLAAVESAS
jgi:hypothetical protein